MAYAIADFNETIDRVHEIAIADIAAVRYAWGENGDWAEWTGGFIVALHDGRLARITGWCDTSGWGCCDGVELTWLDSADGTTPPLDADYLPADLNRFLQQHQEGSA